MNSGKWIKSVFRLKKLKKGGRKRAKESSVCGKGNNSLRKGSNTLTNGSLGVPIEDVAATRIQTAFRGYKARKALRRLKGALRLQRAIQLYPAQRQSTSTLGHLHSWCNIQSQVRARRLCMVTEGRTKQKKLESQQKLEAKLQNLEVEWSGGAETMDGILAKIYQREEASVKRERAMAYAFSHQWRANCSQSQGLGSDELGKSNWGWSWKERWIAARPWETRVSPKKDQSKKASNKSTKTPKTPVSVKIPVSVKTPVSSVKTPSSKARRLSFPSSEKMLPNNDSPKVKEELVS